MSNLNKSLVVEAFDRLDEAGIKPDSNFVEVLNAEYQDGEAFTQAVDDYVLERIVKQREEQQRQDQQRQAEQPNIEEINDTRELYDLAWKPISEKYAEQAAKRFEETHQARPIEEVEDRDELSRMAANSIKQTKQESDEENPIADVEDYDTLIKMAAQKMQKGHKQDES